MDHPGPKSVGTPPPFAAPKELPGQGLPGRKCFRGGMTSLTAGSETSPMSLAHDGKLAPNEANLQPSSSSAVVFGGRRIAAINGRSWFPVATWWRHDLRSSPF